MKRPSFYTDCDNLVVKWRKQVREWWQWQLTVNTNPVSVYKARLVGAVTVLAVPSLMLSHHCWSRTPQPFCVTQWGGDSPCPPSPPVLYGENTGRRVGITITDIFIINKLLWPCLVGSRGLGYRQPVNAANVRALWTTLTINHRQTKR